MDNCRDKELVELLDKALASLNPNVHQNYLYNLLTYDKNSNKTVKEMLLDEVGAIKEMENS